MAMHRVTVIETMSIKKTVLMDLDDEEAEALSDVGHVLDVWRHSHTATEDMLDEDYDVYIESVIEV
jgi:hypothetical protein